MREQCFDELVRRGPAVTAEDDLDGGRDCVAVAADEALAALGPPIATCCCCSDVHGLAGPLLEAVTDMSEADLQNQLYRARAEFAATFAAAPRPRPLSRAPQRLSRLRRARAPARHPAARAAPPRAAARARPGRAETSEPP